MLFNSLAGPTANSDDHPKDYDRIRAITETATLVENNAQTGTGTVTGFVDRKDTKIQVEQDCNKGIVNGQLKFAEAQGVQLRAQT